MKRNYSIKKASIFVLHFSLFYFHFPSIFSTLPSFYVYLNIFCLFCPCPLGRFSIVSHGFIFYPILFPYIWSIFNVPSYLSLFLTHRAIYFASQVEINFTLIFRSQLDQQHTLTDPNNEIRVDQIMNINSTKQCISTRPTLHLDSTNIASRLDQTIDLNLTINTSRLNQTIYIDSTKQ